MRLIDADALIEAMKKTESEYENAMTCPSWWSAFNVISEQQTAYSVDKVVEELEKLQTYNMSCVTLMSDLQRNGVCRHYICLEDAIKIIKQEADQFGTDTNVGSKGWIPCSERLPEEAFGCLVTVMDCNPSTQTEFENILPYVVGYDGESWNDEDGNVIPFEVIAWQPLPEPFKERD